MIEELLNELKVQKSEYGKESWKIWCIHSFSNFSSSKRGSVELFNNGGPREISYRKARESLSKTKRTLREAV